MIIGMSGENAFGTAARAWVWQERYATVMRFMQDQPLVYDSKMHMKRGKVAAPYTTLLHQILAQARAAGTVI